MNRGLRALVPASFLAVGLVAGACDVSVNEGGDVSVNLVSGLAEEEDQRSYTLPSDGAFEIQNRNGAIELSAWDEATVEVAIHRQAKARSDEAARALLEQVQIREEVEPARVRLSTEGPRDGSIRVRYVVRAPRTLATVLANENGSLQVEGMAGAVQATMSNGAVTAREIAGAIEASTVNGPVSVELTAVGGEVTLSAVNGPVRITIPETAKATLSARVVNGRIRTSGLTLEDLDQPSGREMDGSLNGGGPAIRLETTNGPIVITGQR